MGVCECYRFPAAAISTTVSWCPGIISHFKCKKVSSFHQCMALGLLTPLFIICSVHPDCQSMPFHPHCRTKFLVDHHVLPTQTKTSAKIVCVHKYTVRSTHVWQYSCIYAMITWKPVCYIIYICIHTHNLKCVNIFGIQSKIRTTVDPFCLFNMRICIWMTILLATFFTLFI